MNFLFISYVPISLQNYDGRFEAEPRWLGVRSSRCWQNGNNTRIIFGTCETMFNIQLLRRIGFFVCWSHTQSKRVDILIVCV